MTDPAISPSLPPVTSPVGTGVKKPEDIIKELSERFKESHFKLTLVNRGGKYWYQLDRADNGASIHYNLQLLPYESVQNVSFLKYGAALKLPYGVLPKLDGEDLKLVELPVGYGSQLFLYVPYNNHHDFIGQYRMVSADYSNDPLKAEDGKSYDDIPISTEKRENLPYLPLHILYPPQFDYMKAFNITAGNKIEFEKGEEKIRDICIVVDDSGSMSEYSIENTASILLFPSWENKFLRWISSADKFRLHLVSSSTGKVAVAEGERPKDVQMSNTYLNDVLVNSLKKFFQPKGEAEDLAVGFDICRNITASDKFGGLNFVVTDSEAEIPALWFDNSVKELPIQITRVFNFSEKPAHIKIGAKLKIPLPLAERIFDSQISNFFSDETEINQLTEKVNSAILNGTPNKNKLFPMVESFLKKAHLDVRGEEKLRRAMPLLTLLPQEKTKQSTDWLVSMVKDKNYDYPLKSRAVFIAGYLGFKGATDVIKTLMALKNDIEDVRLKEDISTALSFISSTERARLLWDTAQIDPNGVDLEEVKNCGLNDYTIKILGHVIRDGLLDKKERALDVVETFLLSDMRGFDDLNLEEISSLYWSDGHIKEIKSALLKAQSRFEIISKMYYRIDRITKKLDAVTAVLARHVQWEERKEFSQNKLNMPHYFVKTDMAGADAGIRDVRAKSDTEEAFLCVTTSKEGLICYEYGDSEELGSVRPLPPDTMSKIIPEKPKAMSHRHIHPGRPTGKFSTHDMPSSGDILTFFAELIEFGKIYGDDIAHEIEMTTPNGKMILRPLITNTNYITKGLFSPNSKLIQAIRGYMGYVSLIFKGTKAADVEEVKKLLSPIFEVEFIKSETVSGGGK